VLRAPVYPQISSFQLSVNRSELSPRRLTDASSVDRTILLILIEISKLPSAAKAWRIQVGDAFNESRFFQVKMQEARLWKDLVCALMDSDKERFGELLGMSEIHVKTSRPDEGKY